MGQYKIQRVFKNGWDVFSSSHALSPVQEKAAHAIMECKSGTLGCSVSRCPDCGHMEIHNNSCRNRNCPNCQAVQKEVWVDKRRSEVIDAPYFHVVFTLPHELNSLLCCNQRLLYGLLHKCCAETLLDLSSNPKWLGATPGIIQVLHTWNQELGYHVHMHCIVSGGGLTKAGQIRRSKGKFFIPVQVLRDKFQGKYLALLDGLYQNGELTFPSSCAGLRNRCRWGEFKDRLYGKEWCPYIKETFNGFGNAIEYLGHYANKVAISNSRIRSVTDTEVTFSARGRKPGDPKRTVTLKNEEFIRRFLMHVLPSGFQKIRYYGFLNNRMKSQNLKLIFRLQGHQRFKRRYAGMTVAELLWAAWGVPVHVCAECGCMRMRQVYRAYEKPRP